jgi:RHS repeat-associated protein
MSYSKRITKGVAMKHIISSIVVWACILTASILVCTQDSFASSDVIQETRTAGGVYIGDPITADGGSYYFTIPLLNLGGVLPLQTALSYYMNSVNGDSGFYYGFNHTMVDVPNARISRGDTGDEIVFFKQTNGSYTISAGVRTVYALKMTTGYYYMLDPDLQRVFVFEKQSGSKHRIKWVFDRNNNRLTYEYGANQFFPSAIYEEGGGQNDRRFAVATVTIYGTVHPTGITERIYSGGAWQDGRSVLFGRGDCSSWTGVNNLCSVTDPAGNTTSFYHDLADFSFPVTRLTKPAGNIPYTQRLTYQTLDRGGAYRVGWQTNAYGNVTQLRYGYLVGDRYPITEIRPDGSASTYLHYGEFTPPASIQDPSGKKATFTKSTGMIDNRIASVTDRMGATSAFTYHQQTGKIATITNASGKVLSNTYTEQIQTFTNIANQETVEFSFYNLTRIDYPDATSEQFTFDTRGNVLTRKDRAGKDWAYTYNDKGQTLTATNPTGGIITTTYNADGTPASKTDADGVRATYFYDVHKRLSRITNMDATFTQIAYDDNDRMTSITDENNRTLTYTYDANGNLTVVTDPAGKTTRYAYDLMDRTTGITDRLGHTTTFGYDTMNRLASTTDPNALTSTFAYNTRGWKTGTTRGGKTWLTGYDDEGIVSSSTTPLGFTTTVQSDNLGYTTGTTNPLNQTTTLARDSMSRVTGITDPLGRTSSFSYDGRGLLSGASLPLVGSASYTRNDIGLLTGITDLKGSVWGFGYTAAGKLQSATDPLSNTTGYGYDARGRLATTTYPGGATETRTYDGTTHVTRLLYSDGTDLQFGYDALGRIISANNISLTRDDEGQVTSTTDSGMAFGATYDSGGRLKTATYNNNLFTVTYSYDATTGLLSGVTDSLTGAQTGFAYDNDNRLTGITRSNGVNSTFTFDHAGRLTRLQDGAIIDLQYTFDAAGQITGVAMIAPFDPASVIADSTSDFAYNAASQISTAGYAYDSRGRLTASPGHTFTWDDASRLTGTGSAALAYNGLNDLVTRSEAGQTMHFYYNKAIGLSPVIAEKSDTSGQFVRYYVWTPNGRLLYMIDAADGNKIYFHHFDHIGSTLALTDGAGAVTDSYAYTPYGKLLGHNGATQQPFTFAGMWGVRQEGSSGSLYHMRARYYDATTARFISKEPIWPVPAKPLELNPYQYAHLNPATFVDVTGLGLASHIWQFGEGVWNQETPISNPPNDPKTYGTTTPASWIKQYESLEEMASNYWGNRQTLRRMQLKGCASSQADDAFSRRRKWEEQKRWEKLNNIDTQEERWARWQEHYQPSFEDTIEIEKAMEKLQEPAREEQRKKDEIFLKQLEVLVKIWENQMGL